MARALKIQQAGNIDIGFVSQSQPGNIGVVGGSNTAANVSGFPVVQVFANIEYLTGQYAAGPAYIVAQKGRHEFLMANTVNPTRQSLCFLVNEPNGNVLNLTANQASVVCKQDQSSGPDTNFAAFVITNKRVIGFPPDFVNYTNVGNMVNAPAFNTTFAVAGANLTPQPGSNLPTAQVLGYGV
jgi:hypothetical protein